MGGKKDLNGKKIKKKRTESRCGVKFQRMAVPIYIYIRHNFITHHLHKTKIISDFYIRNQYPLFLSVLFKQCQLIFIQNKIGIIHYYLHMITSLLDY